MDKKLKNWIISYQNLYGFTHMTMNVHNLNHCVHFIRLYGPQRVFSCFPFESMMGFIKKRVHSTKDFMKTYAITSSLLENIGNLEKEVQDQAPLIKV